MSTKKTCTDSTIPLECDFGSILFRTNKSKSIKETKPPILSIWPLDGGESAEYFQELFDVLFNYNYRLHQLNVIGPHISTNTLESTMQLLRFTGVYHLVLNLHKYREGDQPDTTDPSTTNVFKVLTDILPQNRIRTLHIGGARSDPRDVEPFAKAIVKSTVNVLRLKGINSMITGWPNSDILYKIILSDPCSTIKELHVIHTLLSREDVQSITRSLPSSMVSHLVLENNFDQDQSTRALDGMASILKAIPKARSLINFEFVQEHTRKNDLIDFINQLSATTLRRLKLRCTNIDSYVVEKLCKHLSEGPIGPLRSIWIISGRVDPSLVLNDCARMILFNPHLAITINPVHALDNSISELKMLPFKKRSHSIKSRLFSLLFAAKQHNIPCVSGPIRKLPMELIRIIHRVMQSD